MTTGKRRYCASWAKMPGTTTSWDQYIASLLELAEIWGAAYAAEGHKCPKGVLPCAVCAGRKVVHAW